MIVVDCSAVVSFLLDPQKDETLAASLTEGEILAAPDLIDVECLSAFRRLELSKRVTPAQAANFIGLFALLRLTIYPSRNLLEPIWTLRRNFSAYDAAYVALAASLDVPLLTADQRLHRAVVEHTPVKVLPTPGLDRAP